jgi:monovalent cation/proton antiporter MnhG/PhaG subunit
MLMLISVILKLAGVAFLCIAGLGVMRLSDPFQRMHAATKAGTLGAGLVILGSVIGHGATDATIMGVLTIVFLLLTVPVAGHLLGRASYVSGATLSLRGKDALDGVLERSSRPLDERMGWLPVEDDGPAPAAAPVAIEPARPKRSAPPRLRLEPLDAVRFVVIDGQVEPVARRAGEIASRHSASLSAHALIDTAAFETAEEPARARQLIRDRASGAIRKLRSCMTNTDIDAALNYDEGNPEHLLGSADQGRALLVLPCHGWFHHQVEVRRALTTWEPDGLLRLPTVHQGPVLYASSKAPTGAAATIVIRDRGEAHLADLVEWALASDLWPTTHIVHVANQGASALPYLEDAAHRYGCTLESRLATQDDCSIPSDIRGVRAVILGQTPRPRRTTWFGSPWLNRISPGFAGDVLLMEGRD